MRAEHEHVRQGQEVDVWPAAFGGKNWSPVSFNPGTGLIYANTLNFGMHYKPTTPEYRAGLTYWGADISWIWPDGARGGLKAIDPMTGKAKWEALTDIPRFSGVLSTAGGVVFSVGAINYVSSRPVDEFVSRITENVLRRLRM